MSGEDPKPNQPCPFCGGEDLAALDLTVETARGREEGFAISCARCLSQGPTKDTLRQSIEGWNFRGLKYAPRA